MEVNEPLRGWWAQAGPECSPTTFSGIRRLHFKVRTEAKKVLG